VDLNTAKPPLDQLEVRQALNHAFNRDELLETVFFGVFEPASSPLAKATFGYDASVEGMYPYDLDRAQELLDVAGWVMGDNGIRQKDGQEFRLNCLIGTSEEDSAIAQVMQAQWEPLGIAIDINVIAGTALTTAKREGEHNIGFKIAVYQDPDILGAYFHPNSVGGFNYTFYDAPELAELLDRGVAALDPEERQQIYSELSFYMMENALLIPIYYLSNLSAASENLEGLVHDTAGYWWYYDAWFRDS
jgi:peptide/nickel transport system substrate-binding protein